MELKAYQFAFYHDKDNLQHLALDKQLRQKLFNLKSAERLFFAQKLKCNFFKDYDKGSSFFFLSCVSNIERTLSLLFISVMVSLPLLLMK
jgi:hypothetical protein